jgi:hypothetical protein
VTDDPDLRARLERLASSAGDPPEQGLEKVAARRHRRLRRRRGAVVTAAALAVLLIGLSTVVEGGNEPDDVAVSRADRPSPGRIARLPNEVTMRCGPRGIEIPVASVRPQREGLHVRVINDHAVSTEVWVVNGEEDWSSGEVSVDPGPTNLRVPVPPGVLTIGCRIAGHDHERRVDLDDVDGYYRAPQLACDEEETIELHELSVVEPTGSLKTATRDALAPYVALDDVAATAVRGYTSQRLGDPWDEPVVQVERDGDVEAFVYFGKRENRVDRKWVKVPLVVGCKDFLGDAASTTTTQG